MGCRIGVIAYNLFAGILTEDADGCHGVGCEDCYGSNHTSEDSAVEGVDQLSAIAVFLVHLI